MQTCGKTCGLHGDVSAICDLHGYISPEGGLQGIVSAFSQCPELEKRIEEVEKCCETNAENIGDLDDLDTEDKSNLVDAINEISQKTDTNYVYDQSQAQTVWTITHNLGKMPSITVIDSAGTVVQGEYEMIDVNTVKLTFSAPFAGKAILN